MQDSNELTLVTRVPSYALVPLDEYTESTPSDTGTLLPYRVLPSPTKWDTIIDGDGKDKSEQLLLCREFILSLSVFPRIRQHVSKKASSQHLRSLAVSMVFCVPL